MFVKDYLSKDFIPPSSKQTAEMALRLVDGYNLSHVPVFEGLTFIGNIAEDTLESLSLDAAIADFKMNFEHFYLTDSSTIFDAINIMYIHNTNIAPVFDHEEHYLGYITVEDINSALSTMPFVSEPGAVMLVEASAKNYSFSEMARIVESNNARLFGLVISKYYEDRVQILVKLGAENLISVGETFERFGYEVIHKFYNDEKQEMLKDRLDQLMKYLNI